MLISSAAACAFSGYRPEKFSFPMVESHPQFEHLCREIETAIRGAVGDGYTTFFCGMARGFDLLCGALLLDLREQEEYRGISLVVALPYQGEGFSGWWGTLYHRVRKNADDETVLCAAYTQDCFARRNRYMVEHSSRLICYWDGQEGGTAQTVRMAERQGLEVVNLAAHKYTQI